MIGLKELERECWCGSIGNHELIVGKVRSEASGRYPWELCDKCARLAVTQ